MLHSRFGKLPESSNSTLSGEVTREGGLLQAVYPKGARVLRLRMLAAKNWMKRRLARSPRARTISATLHAGADESPYARGMATREIAAQVGELYGHPACE
jgi:hypothetical protein